MRDPDAGAIQTDPLSKPSPRPFRFGASLGAPNSECALLRFFLGMPRGPLGVVFTRFLAVANRLLRVVMSDQRPARRGGIGLFFVVLRSLSMFARRLFMMFRRERVMVRASMVPARSCCPFVLRSCGRRQRPSFRDRSFVSGGHVLHRIRDDGKGSAGLVPLLQSGTRIRANAGHIG